ncbi:uncharacterized protein LOC144153402 [Haemaphysalis longicornis]
MGNCITRSRYRGLLNWFQRGEQRDATGLTEHEKKALRQVWQEFCCAHDDYGVLIFQAFFIKYPDHLNLFKEFRGRTLRTLTNDPKLRAHCNLVGYELTCMIESLDNPAELLELMRKLGVFHQRQRGVKARYFNAFGHVTVDVLIANHEDRMTSVAKKAFHKFFETMTRVVTHVYDEAAKAPTGTARLSWDSLAHGPTTKPSSPKLVAEPAVEMPSIAAADATDGRALDSEPGQPLGSQGHDIETGTGASGGGAVTSGRLPSVFQETKTAPQGTSDPTKELGEGASGLKGTKRPRAASIRPGKTGADPTVLSRRASKASTMGKASGQVEPDLDPNRQHSTDSSHISIKQAAGHRGSATVTLDAATVDASDRPLDSAVQSVGVQEPGEDPGRKENVGGAGVPFVQSVDVQEPGEDPGRTENVGGAVVPFGRPTNITEGDKRPPQDTLDSAKELTRGASVLKREKRSRAASLRPEKSGTNADVLSRRASKASVVEKPSSQVEPQLGLSTQRTTERRSSNWVVEHGGSSTSTTVPVEPVAASVSALDEHRTSAGQSAGVKEPAEDSAKRESVGGAGVPFGRHTHITEGDKGPPQDTSDSTKELTRGASILKREKRSRAASLRPEKPGSNAVVPSRRASKASVFEKPSSQVEPQLGLSTQRTTERISSNLAVEHGGSSTSTTVPVKPVAAAVTALIERHASEVQSVGVQEPGEDPGRAENVGGTGVPFGRPTNITEDHKGPPQDTSDSTKELTHGASVLKREKRSRAASLRPEKPGSNAVVPFRRASKASIVEKPSSQVEPQLGLSRQLSTERRSSNLAVAQGGSSTSTTVPVEPVAAAVSALVERRASPGEKPDGQDITSILSTA